MLQLLAAVMAVATSSYAQSSTPPLKGFNILHIVVDDVGYQDLGNAGRPNATRGLITPHLDKWVAEGVRLSNFHAQPICSPTRSALMTGAYPLRISTQASVFYWNTPACAPSSKEYPWIPEQLKANGYGRTAMFGKSHLGYAWNGCLPTERGFDTFEGFLQGCGNYETHLAAQCSLPVPPLPPLTKLRARPGREPGADSPPAPPNPYANYLGYDWFQQEEIYVGANGTYSEWLIQDRAVAFLKETADLREAGDAEASKPFYMYLPFQNIHTPLEVQPKWRELYPHLDGNPDMQTLQGMISAADDAIGTVLQALVETGLSEKTFIWLHSDNGAPPTADTMIDNKTRLAVRNYPLRGWKTQIWEGGTRVPSFIWAPKAVLGDKAGTVYDEMVHVTDISRSFIEGIAGGRMAGPHAPDGFDQISAIIGGGAPARNEMLYNINPLCNDGQAGPPKAGVRVGDMKLLCECWDQGTMACTGEQYLFNISADIGEYHNLAAEMPDTVKALTERLVHYASDQVYPQQWTAPYLGPDYFCADCPLGNRSMPYNAWRPYLKTPDPWPALPKLPPHTHIE